METDMQEWRPMMEVFYRLLLSSPADYHLKVVMRLVYPSDPDSCTGTATQAR
jgi:hypothetical protein